jgi:hypothetical protein
MSPSAPTRGSTVPRANSQSYLCTHPAASGSPKNPSDFRPEILASDLTESLNCLIRSGQIEAWPQAESVETRDGVRTRRDFTLYCLCRGGGEP